ncbi:MAG: hypothetical protein HGB12_15380, partial [Bacteroidetes bacterium]|nr:hypothetical protein [Bacteroidota bacterium]
MKKTHSIIYILLIFFSHINCASAQWSDISYLTNSNLRSVFFNNILTGFSVGDSGTVIKTINGGSSWSLVSVPSNKNFKSVFF